MYFLQLAIGGLAAGGAYALSSVGMVCIYKGTRVINFAQGGIGMIGAYVYANWVAAGKNVWEGAILGVVASIVIGLITYFAVMIPLRRASGLSRMIASFGVVLLLEGIADVRWGTAEETVNGLTTSTLHFGGLSLSSAALLTVIAALVFSIIISVYFTLTKIGRATEAASISAEGAKRLGYNADLLGALTWLIGSTAAGIAAILIVPILGLDETGLTLVVIYATVGALAGSFQRIWLAVGASFAMGIVAALVDGQVSQIQGLDEVIPVVVVTALLLLGSEAIPGYANESERLPFVPRRTLRKPMAAVLLVATVLSLVLFSSFWQDLLVQGAGLAIVCLSFVLVIGYLGQISLMQWSLGGLGAFIAASLLVNNHWPYVLAVLIGAVASMVVACLIGIPALRLRGVNLAIVTLATSVAIGTLVLNQFNSGNGYNMPQPSVAGHQLQGRTLVIVSLALVAIVAAVLYWIRTSWYGKRILALRTSERAANAVGIPAFRYKLIVFSGGGFLAGIGGSLWASGVGVINATSFDPLTSIMLLSFAYINGVGSITAGIIAGMAVALGSPFMTNVLHVNGFGWFNVIGGVGLIWTLIVHPNGALVRVPHSRNGKATEAPHRGRGLEALRPGRSAEALQQERTAKTEAL